MIFAHTIDFVNMLHNSRNLDGCNTSKSKHVQMLRLPPPSAPITMGRESSSLPTRIFTNTIDFVLVYIHKGKNKFHEYHGNHDDDNGNGNDGDYEIEGGLYCDRIPVVPAGAMTVLFTLSLPLCVVSDNTAMSYCDTVIL